jgi:sugar-specific transcriptional regulator TrmB
MQTENEKLDISLFDAGPDSSLYEYRVRLEKIKEALLKFGLTPNQAKVYIYLGKYGSKTAPEVFKALNLPRTETYFILNTLERRGILTSELTSPTRYTALSIENMVLAIVNAEKEKLSILANQKNEVAEMWNDLPAFAVETNETKNDKVQMLQGSPQIHSKMMEMIKSAREQLLILCTEKDIYRFYHAEMIDILANYMIDFRIIISPAQTLPSFLNGIDKRHLRLMPRNNTENQCFVIKDSVEVLQFLRNANYSPYNAFSLWTDSKSMTDSMKMLFDFAWETAESIY